MPSCMRPAESGIPMTDKEALKAFSLLCRLEGIIPALESSHAVACAVKVAPKLPSDYIMIINLPAAATRTSSQSQTRQGKRYEPLP